MKLSNELVLKYLLAVFFGLFCIPAISCETAKPLFPGALELQADQWYCSGYSETGSFKVFLKPLVDSKIPLRKHHSWLMSMKWLDGKSLDGAMVVLDGGMPDHGHGLPTRPRIVQGKTAGDFIIEGLKFNMAGVWELDIIIQQPIYDKFTFSIELEN